MFNIKTLLLVFVHGFKGDDDTFHEFPSHLQDLIKDAASDGLDIVGEVYPKYETRGDLPKSVESFQEWLVHSVLTLEKVSGNTTPRAQPTVGVIIVAHSMGGLVATDSLLSILNQHDEPRTKESPPLFPMIQGILSFDTPYCGLSRSMFAYGAFAQYQNVTSAYGMISTLTSALPVYGAATASSAGTLIASGTVPAWRAWQAVAMKTGAAGAIAAAGAAAYTNRAQIQQGLGYLNKEDISKGLSAVNMENLRNSVSRVNIEEGLAYISRENIGAGLGWLSGHLQFVSALTRGAELQNRLERVSAMQGIGFANLYTSLGQNDLWSGGYFVAERTFCAIPAQNARANRFFIKEVNTVAKDETIAHISMFRKEKNSGYDEMSAHARGLVLSWSKNNTGRVLDPYRGRETKEADTVTKYTYNASTGLKSIDPTTGKTSAYWSTPTYAGLISYIPSMGRSSTPAPDSSVSATESSDPIVAKPASGGWSVPTYADLASYLSSMSTTSAQKESAPVPLDAQDGNTLSEMDPLTEKQGSVNTPIEQTTGPSSEPEAVTITEGGTSAEAGTPTNVPKEGDSITPMPKEGWSYPTYANLTSYIPSIPGIGSRSTSRERTRSTSPGGGMYGSGLSRYLWGPRNEIRSKLNDASTDAQIAAKKTTAEGSPTEEGTPTDSAVGERRAEERADELLQFNGTFPGVTEDLLFEEQTPDVDYSTRGSGVRL